MPVTLVLTRQPDTIFNYATGVQDSAANARKMWFANEQGRFGTLVVFTGDKINGVELLKGDKQSGGSVTVPGGSFAIDSKGSVSEVARFTTLERFDHNMVSLHRQKVPFHVQYEINNPKVSELPQTGGRCLRVLGGHTEEEKGILLHAAPHVGWLSGCISPRKLDDKKPDTESTYQAMLDLYAIVGKERAEFYITDS